MSEPHKPIYHAKPQLTFTKESADCTFTLNWNPTAPPALNSEKNPGDSNKTINAGMHNM